MSQREPLTAIRKWQIIAAILATMVMGLASTFIIDETEEARSLANFVSRYPLLDISRHFVPQENFIVNLEPLRTQLAAIVAREGTDTISVYVEFLNTGAHLQVNPGLRVWPASLPKVPLAMAVMKKVERGEWALDSELVLFEEDKDDSYGDVWGRPVGTRFTIADLLSEMLVHSDNTSYRMLFRNLDARELTAVIDEMGISELFSQDGRITVKEYSRIFRTLYVSSYLSRESSEMLLQHLRNATFSDFLSTGIPVEVPFAHKFGVGHDVGVYLDSGIVYVPGRPYLITVAVEDPGPDAEARVGIIMEEISSAAYHYVSGK